MDRKPKSSVIRSIMWAGTEAGLGLIISMGTLLGIAKLIGVEEFGLGSLAAGLVMMMAVIAATLVHDAVVQRDDLTPEHRVAAWWGAVGGGLLLTLLTIMAAPLLSAIYENSRVGWLMVAVAPSVLLDSMAGPILADRRRQMDFGSTARRMLIGRAAGMIVGLTLAWFGAGAWSVVWQQLVSSGVSFFLLLQLRERLPDAPFRWSALWDLLRFTRHLIGTQVLIQAGERAFLAYVGYALSFTAAGYWSLAHRLVETISGTVQSSLYHVALSHFSRLQSRRGELSREVDLWVRYMMLGLTIFVSVGLVTADQIVLLAMGEAWLGAVPAIQIMLVSAILPLRRLFPMVAITSTGRPFIGIQCFLVETIVSMPILFLAGIDTLVGVAVLRVFRNLIGYLVAAWAARKQLWIGLRFDLFWLGANVLMIAAGIAVALVAREVTGPLGWHPFVMMVIEGVAAGSVTTIAALLAQPRLVELLTAQYRKIRGRGESSPELVETGQVAQDETGPQTAAGR